MRPIASFSRIIFTYQIERMQLTFNGCKDGHNHCSVHPKIKRVISFRDGGTTI